MMLAALAANANAWHELPGRIRIHRTAIVGFQPLRSPSFARPIDDHQPLPDIGDNVVIGPNAVIYAGCVIGADTVVCPNASIREGVQIGRRCVIGFAASLGYDAVIGDDVKIMDYSEISGGTVVGDRCFVSVQVLVVNDDRPGSYKWGQITPARIGSDCVIGAGARLRPGVVIGNGATIAMGAVVTRDVAMGATVKGLPAREEGLRHVPV